MTETTTPATQMFQMITGYWITQIVHGAAVAGYAERLHQGAASAEDLAKAAGMDPTAVFRHLRACAGLGLVTYKDGLFSATPLLDILRKDHPQSLRGFALSQPAPGHWLPWGRFTDALRTGTMQTHATLGCALFDHFARTPAEADAFTEAMEGLTAAICAEAARVLDVTQARKVVDVGGASGALLAALLEAHPALSGAVFDLPYVVEGPASSNIPEAIGRRMHRIGGDFFQSVPAADLYLLKWILHDWNDDECLTILRNCRSAIAPDGRIAIFELVLGEVGEARLAPLMDLNMLVMLTGKERTLAEYSQLLARAGFGDVALTRTATPISVITARPVN